MQLDIPEQHKGAQSNTEHSVTAKSKDEAHTIFKVCRERLLDINSWHKLSGTASADFTLIADSGKEEDRKAIEGDYFKIAIPFTGSSSGEGYDWVKVEKIEDKSNPGANEESFLMRVRPATNPNNISEEVAHFLSDDATSTFVIIRKGHTVTASVFGRNEVPNKDAEKIVDKIRNTLVTAGAVAGGSKIQWKLLVKGLLATEVTEK